jgi:protein-disulfide isomerase
MTAPRLSSALALLSLFVLVPLGAAPLAQAPRTQPPAADPLLAAADKGRILGAPTAPLWLLVVSDFQCPYCRQWHQETWHTLKKEFVDTGKIRVAYVNFPLGIHPNAKPAARYAMCASTLGKFWEYADRLFETQAQWKDLPDPNAFFSTLAERAKLPSAAMKSCVANPAIPTLIDADYSRMSRAGAGSTPTFFIGRTRIEGAEPIATFRRAIAAELAALGRP